eukprot:m.1195161 g.1195161  ORF g.1195161 m.1195161 type:complete len:238 (-) comp24562_c1_seq59:3886-4599(-)
MLRFHVLVPDMVADIRYLIQGGTTSLLHNDADNLISCQLWGDKQWIFIHPQYRKELDFADYDPIHDESPELFDGSDISLINASRVDLTKHDVRDIPWHHAHVHAGDCLFLPSQYIHQVRSYGRNLAVSFIFLKEDHAPFHDKGCNTSKSQSNSVRMSEFRVAWDFTGDGEILIGYPSPKNLRAALQRFIVKYDGRLEMDDLKFEVLDYYTDIADNLYGNRDESLEEVATWPLAARVL